MNELEVLSVVVGVAAGAIFIARERIPNYGVESLVRVHARGNLRVTLQALQAFAAHGQSMASDALSGAIDGLMRAGKWAGGNLGAKISHGREACNNTQHDCDDRPPHQP
jgi:hypothetical protein